MGRVPFQSTCHHVYLKSRKRKLILALVQLIVGTDKPKMHSATDLTPHLTLRASNGG